MSVKGRGGFPHDTRPSTFVSFRISRFGFRILLEVHIDPHIGLRSNIQFFQFLTKFGTETRKYAMIAFPSVCRDELLPDSIWCVSQGIRCSNLSLLVADFDIGISDFN